jgi:hypothetical protein
MPKPQQGTPLDLEIEEAESGFVLTFAGAPITTDSGTIVAHKSADLLQHMIDEFNWEGSIVVRNGVIEKPRRFSDYALVVSNGERNRSSVGGLHRES